MERRRQVFCLFFFLKKRNGAMAKKVKQPKPITYQIDLSPLRFFQPLILDVTKKLKSLRCHPLALSALAFMASYQPKLDNHSNSTH